MKCNKHLFTLKIIVLFKKYTEEKKGGTGGHDKFKKGEPFLSHLSTFLRIFLKIQVKRGKDFMTN